MKERQTDRQIESQKERDILIRDRQTDKVTKKINRERERGWGEFQTSRIEND